MYNLKHGDEVQLLGLGEDKKSVITGVEMFRKVLAEGVITPPTAEELERRLRGRGTETEEVIKGRMERAKEEAQGMDQYDYVLINDDLETCVKQMHETIQSQHFMSSNQKDFIEQMKKSLEK